MKIDFKGNKVVAISLFAGIIVGAIVANLTMAEKMYILGNYAIDNYNAYAMSKVDKNNLFITIVLKRFKQIAIVGILMMAINPYIILNIVAFVFGSTIGMLLAIETMRLGLKGVLYTIICFLPQYIIYIAGFMLTIYWVSKKYVKDNLYFDDSNGKIRKIIPIIIIFLIFLIGSGFEAYINPIFLKNFYQYIVP